MQFIQEVFTQTLEVKQSKFIAYLTPFSQYHQILSELKVSHPKARHFVVAYRYLNEFSQILEYSSDDGEPKGTSGKPSLMVLQGQSIVNTAVIVVRYFGGTKLGTGGLVRAYSDAVNLVIEDAVLYPYIKLLQKKITFNYADLRLIEYECMENHISIISKSFEDEVFYILEASEESMRNFINELQKRNCSITLQEYKGT